MKVPDLPPELGELLERLKRCGIPITPLELARLRHLLGVHGVIRPADWLPLLSALLCKDERHRTLLRREYERWEADHEPGFEPHPETDEGGARAGQPRVDLGRGTEGLLLGDSGAGAAHGARRRLDWRRFKRYRRYMLGIAAGMLLLTIGLHLVTPIFGVTHR